MVSRIAERPPDRGDLVWLTFDPQAGHEQKGRRPALILSPLAYNRKLGLALACPITSRAKGYPFEVPLPEGLPIHGEILADQIKNLDWRARQCVKICSLNDEVVREVLRRIETLLSITPPR